MRLVALDLEGSGAADREDEAILEIALVPLDQQQEPDLSKALTSLVNPGRAIPQRPWTSPGLTNDVLRTAPPLADIEPQLAEHLHGAHLIGHNVGVDWKLLHRRCPSVKPAGLIDTLKLARSRHPGQPNSLAAVIQRHDLTEEVNRLAPHSQPHRALWDTIAAALLYRRLTADHPDPRQILAAAGIPISTDVADQPSLFDLPSDR